MSPQAGHPPSLHMEGHNYTTARVKIFQSKHSNMESHENSVTAGPYPVLDRVKKLPIAVGFVPINVSDSTVQISPFF